MKLTIPELCLVVLIGPSGCGKSTFARKHFKTTEVLSSDYCRALVSDDENNQQATTDAFDVLHYIAGKRLMQERGFEQIAGPAQVQPPRRGNDREHRQDRKNRHHCRRTAAQRQCGEAQDQEERGEWRHLTTSGNQQPAQQHPQTHGDDGDAIAQQQAGQWT